MTFSKQDIDINLTTSRQKWGGKKKLLEVLFVAQEDRSKSQVFFFKKISFFSSLIYTQWNCKGRVKRVLTNVYHHKYDAEPFHKPPNTPLLFA